VVDDMVHPDDRHLLKEAFDEVLEKPGIPVKTTFRTKHKKGYYIWTEAIYTNWLNDENINAIVCNFRDITEQVLANEEIRRKTEQVENILDSVTDGFIAFNNDMCFTYVNKRMSEILRMPPEELLGKYVWDLFPVGKDSE